MLRALYAARRSPALGDVKRFGSSDRHSPALTSSLVRAQDKERTMKDFIELLIKNNLATYSDLRPCIEEEIKKLEEHFQFRLPKKFREYLLVTGHGAGEYKIGSDYQYKYLFDLTRQARCELKRAGNPFQLPEDAFVFFGHQGYIFAWFNVSDGDDPPVYTYSIMAEEKRPKSWASSFSEYLTKSVIEQMQARR